MSRQKVLNMFHQVSVTERTNEGEQNTGSGIMKDAPRGEGSTTFGDGVGECFEDIGKMLGRLIDEIGNGQGGVQEKGSAELGEGG